MTVGCAVLFLGLPVGAHFWLAHDPAARILVQSMLLILLGGTALFSIQGYEVRGQTLGIVRPLWVTRVDLTGLTERAVDPGAVGWTTLRVVGSSGLFGFWGWFYNARLGRFRAWVTDPDRTVVLRLGTKVLVVSPDQPEEFVRALPGSQTTEIVGKQV